MDDLGQVRHDVLAPLSPRQCQVLEELGHGRRYKEIACDLRISLSTVQSHVHHAMEKLGASTATEAAVRFARGEGSRPDPIA